MSYSDTWLRRHALQLCGQLPESYADGIAVLKHMREIWDHLHLKPNTEPIKVACPGEVSCSHCHKSESMGPHPVARIQRQPIN